MAGHLHWEIADWCNYRCSYCCEGRAVPKRAERPYVSDETIERVRGFLSGLDSGWTIRLAAGEPSSHPRLLEIVESVISSGHRVAMETNLSLPLERYLTFVAAARGRLDYLHVSFHPEHADAEGFLSKCLAVREALAREGVSSGFYPAAVAAPGNLAVLEGAASLFERAGLSLHLQRHYADGGYADQEEAPAALLERFEPTAFSRSVSPLGRPCQAGRRWLLLDIQGRVWRCHSARAGRGDCLGNVTEGGRLLAERAEACPFAVCHCPGRPIAED